MVFCRFVQENPGVLCCQNHWLSGSCNAAMWIDSIVTNRKHFHSFITGSQGMLLPKCGVHQCPLWATVVHSLTNFTIWSFTFRLPRLQPLQLFLWPRYVLKVTKHLAWWYFADLSKKTLEFFVVKIIDYRVHVMLQCELTLLWLIENIFILL